MRQADIKQMENSKEQVNQTRERRRQEVWSPLPQAEKDGLIHQYHPDYKKEAYRTLRVGPNCGDSTVHELANLLEGRGPVDLSSISMTPHDQADVLVVGGGGAGATAALTAHSMGADVLLATKLRLGDANTVMAEGGIQVAIAPDDSPVRHFLDSYRGGHMKNDPVLLKALVEDGPKAANWLMDIGVHFDMEQNGQLSLRAGGGGSKPRLLRCKDYTGLELMRTLKDCVQNEEIPLLEYSPVVELLTDGEGNCSGAVFKNLDNKKYRVVWAKTVVLATGGIGRLHIQGFPTSNHYGATGDGLPIAYRAGAKLTLQDTFQYHPTGAVYPEPMAGTLVTEALRSVGAQLVNAKGERFINEMETRDAVAAAVIRECQQGRGIKTPSGRFGVWLDIPLVDILNGAETLTQRFPNMVRQYSRYQIDIRKEPVLIYPTLHYQNGGIKINVDGESDLHNLFVAGEVTGGIHGRNRLMGNSLLDIIVFGRRAGAAASQRARHTAFKELTLKHLDVFYEELKMAGIVSPSISPMLFPDYVRKE